MVKDIVQKAVTLDATDIGYLMLITRASNDNDREIIQLEYHTGTNTNSAACIFYILPPLPPTESDGTWDLSAVTAYPCLVGPTAATTTDPLTCWPSHAKANLAARWILPAGWALVMAVQDANMDGTILVKSITRGLNDA